MSNTDDNHAGEGGSVRDEDHQVFAGVFAPLMVFGSVGVFAALPWELNKILKNTLEWLINVLVTGLLDAAGFFFRAGVKMFLFYQNPREIASLNWYWEHTLLLYVFIIFVSMMLYFVVMMLLADTSDAELQRIIKRFLVSGMLLVISRDLFAFFVALTNWLALTVYPEQYSFDVAMNTVSVLVSIPSAAMATFLIAIVVGVGMMISALVLFVVLAVRMLIIYVVYATLPVWLALWVVDVGPAKYGNVMADLMFRVSAVMMVIGVLISGVIAVGAGVGGSVTTTTGDSTMPVQVMEDGTVVSAADGYGIIHAGDGGAAVASASDVLIELWIYLAIMWVVIALMSSLFGVMMTAGSSSPGGTGGFRGHRGRGRGSAAGSGATYGPGPGGQTYKANSVGQAHVVKGDSGRTYVVNEEGAGFWQDPSSGGRGVFGPGDTPGEIQGSFPSAPDNPTLKEKAGYSADWITRGKYSDAKSAAVSAKQDMTGALKSSGRAGSFMVSAGNLSRRGARAYGSVLKQPTMGESIGEAHRIARASPIANPNKGQVSERIGPDGKAAAYFEGHRAAEGSSAGYSGTEGATDDGKADRAMLGDTAGFGSTADVKGEPGRTVVREQNMLGDTAGFQEATRSEAAAIGTIGGATASGESYKEMMSADGARVAKSVGAPSSYEELTDPEFIAEVYNTAWYGDNVGTHLSQEELIENGITQKEFKQHVLHQKEMGMSPEKAYASAVETLTNPAAEQLGELHVNEETLRSHGMEEIPEEISTAGAFRRVNLDKADAYTEGTNLDSMYRYDFENGKQVYVQKGVSNVEHRVESAKVNGEMMNDIAGRDVTGKKHLDTKNNVLRTENIDGHDMDDVISGDAPVSGDDINKESFVDAYASSGVVGDIDVHGGNVKVTDSGNVKRIDVEKSVEHADIAGDMVGEKAEKHASKLGLDVSKEDVKNRMGEMANQYSSSVNADVEKMQDSVGDMNTVEKGSKAESAVKNSRETVKGRVEEIHGNIDSLRK